jgi:hypothetical protein
MEDYRNVCNLLEKDMFMASIDLLDAYHMIPIDKAYRKYLKFEWKGILYQYTCLPFGLATGPRVFTKVLRPVVQCLRRKGIVCSIYLDDILIGGQGYLVCKNSLTNTLDLLKFLGFLINMKSILTPSQRIQYLGFLFNTSVMKIELPQKKKNDVLFTCRSILKSNVQKIRVIAELIGKLVAASPAVRYSLLYIRQLEVEKNSIFILCVKL